MFYMHIKTYNIAINLVKPNANNFISKRDAQDL